MPGVLTASLLLIALLGLSRLWQVRAGLAPETARKVMHIGVGLISLSFPWLLRENWAVLTVCGLAIAVLLALRTVRALRRNVGHVLHSVERSSAGDLYFLMAVAALFLLARGEWILYLIPLLVLTFADGFAALAGVNYGKVRYFAADGTKSLEGSLAFALVAFHASLIPLLLLTQTGRAETLVVSLLIALLVMLLEAIAWEGLDNLLVPFGTQVILAGHLNAPLRLQLEHLAALLILTSATFLLRRLMPLTGGALVTAAFVLYLCVTLGGWPWALAPLTVAAAGVWSWRGVMPHVEARAQRDGGPSGYSVQVILSLAAPSLVWLLTSVYLGRPQDFHAYALAWAAQLAGLSGYARQVEATGETPSHLTPTQLWQAAGWSLLVLVPHALLSGAHAADWARAAQGALAVGVGLLACALLARRQRLNFQVMVTVMGLVSLSPLLPGSL